MARNVEILSILLLFTNILGARSQDQAACESECVPYVPGDTSKGDYCETICFYTNDDLLQRCSQGGASPAVCKDPEGNIVDNQQPIDNEEKCRRKCFDQTEDCTAYRFSQITGAGNMQGGESGDKAKTGYEFFCSLLKNCRNEETCGVPVKNDSEKGGRKCEKSDEEKKPCPALELTPGINVVHWNCHDMENRSPYDYEMESGTKCDPAHMCENPVINENVKLVCGDEGIWNLADAAGESTPVTDLTLDVECLCPELKIAASEGTVLACTDPVDPAGGFFILNEPNKCTLFCDNYFITELTCGWLPGGSSGISWISSWGDNTEEVTDACLSCWENGCTTI